MNDIDKDYTHQLKLRRVSASNVLLLTEGQAAKTGGEAMKGLTDKVDQDSHSYGWFVNTDDAEDGTTDEDQEKSFSSMFLPDAKPDLAFTAAASESASPLASAGNQDLEVQQALAADTIDDVLGDLF